MLAYEHSLDAKGAPFSFSLIHKFSSELKEKNLRFDYAEVHPTMVAKIVDSFEALEFKSTNDFSYGLDSITLSGFSVYQNTDLADSVIVFYRGKEWAGSIYNIGYIKPDYYVSEFDTI